MGRWLRLIIRQEMLCQGFQYLRRDVIMFTDWYCLAVRVPASCSGCSIIESGPGGRIWSFKVALSWFALSTAKEILRGTLCNCLFLLRLSHIIIYTGLLRVALTILTSFERCLFRMSATSNEIFAVFFYVQQRSLGRIWQYVTRKYFQTFSRFHTQKSSDSTQYLFCF